MTEEVAATWNMNQATCKAIRDLLTESSYCSINSDIKRWYRVLDALYNESLPVIKEKNRNEINKAQNKLIKEYNKYSSNNKRINIKYNISSLRSLLKSFDLEIRFGLRKEGILMAHASDPGLAIAGSY